jgi:transaldolase
MERRLEAGKSLDVHSVASFFVSRVDTEVDKRLAGSGHEELRGLAAIANARAAYERFKEMFRGERFAALRDAGAPVQRPLWASTGVKNPEYSDTMYISELIAPGTVNTMPEKTMKAYADHGSPGTPVQKSYDDAASVMRAVAEAGVDLDDVFRVLEEEGVKKFADSWDELTESVRSELEDKK